MYWFDFHILALDPGTSQFNLPLEPTIVWVHHSQRFKVSVGAGESIFSVIARLKILIRESHAKAPPGMKTEVALSKISQHICAGIALNFCSALNS
jgi:hypothetical protein